MSRAAVYARPDAELRFADLRRACIAAMVPLEDAERWALPDEQVVMAVEAARDGAGLAGGADALQDAVAAGHVLLGSRQRVRAPSWSELLALVSVLRSPVADEAVS